MALFKLVLVGAALLAVAGQYLQEMRRLAIIKRLPGREARDYYERTRHRSERLLAALTIGLAALAVAAVVYAFLLKK